MEKAVKEFIFYKEIEILHGACMFRMYLSSSLKKPHRYQTFLCLNYYVL